MILFNLVGAADAARKAIFNPITGRLDFIEDSSGSGGAGTAINFSSSPADIPLAPVSSFTIKTRAEDNIISLNNATNEVTLNLSSAVFTNSTKTYTATQNFNRLVTVSSLTVNNGSTTINGVPYLWPTTLTGGNCLQTDANGVLSWATCGTGSGGGGDNLGSHVATQTVNVAGFAVVNATGVAAGTHTALAAITASTSNGNSSMLFYASTGNTQVAGLNSTSATWTFPGAVWGNANPDTRIAFSTYTSFISSGVGIGNACPQCVDAKVFIGTSPIQTVTGSPSLLIAGAGPGATANNNPSVILKNYASGNPEFEFAMGTTFGLLGTVTNHGFFIVQNAGTRMVFTSGGGVGIGGNTAPVGSGLDINQGSVTIRQSAGSQAGSVGMTVSSGSIKFTPLAANAASPAANGTAVIYSSNTSGTVEMWVKDSGGNETQISPHNEKGEWIYYSRNTKTGKVFRVNMEKFVRKMQELTGEEFIEEDISRGSEHEENSDRFDHRR